MFYGYPHGYPQQGLQGVPGACICLLGMVRKHLVILKKSSTCGIEALPSHGRSHWFKSSIAHFSRPSSKPPAPATVVPWRSNLPLHHEVGLTSP